MNKQKIVIKNILERCRTFDKNSSQNIIPSCPNKKKPNYNNMVTNGDNRTNDLNSIQRFVKKLSNIKILKRTKTVIYKENVTIIDKLKINKLLIYFCFCFIKGINNKNIILYKAGMKIITSKMDIIAIIKKLIIDKPIKNEIEIDMPINLKNQLFPKKKNN